jgi:hypothetical protein
MSNLYSATSSLGDLADLLGKNMSATSDYSFNLSTGGGVVEDFSAKFDSFWAENLGFLNKPVVATILTVVLISYASVAAPKLPKSVLAGLNNIWVKIVFFALLAYMYKQNPAIALLSAVAFVLSLTLISDSEESGITENFQDEQPKQLVQPTQTVQPVESAGVPQAPQVVEMPAASGPAPQVAQVRQSAQSGQMSEPAPIQTQPTMIATPAPQVAQASPLSAPPQAPQVVEMPASSGPAPQVAQAKQSAQSRQMAEPAPIEAPSQMAQPKQMTQPAQMVQPKQMTQMAQPAQMVQPKQMTQMVQMSEPSGLDSMEVMYADANMTQTVMVPPQVSENRLAGMNLDNVPVRQLADAPVPMNSPAPYPF